MSSGLRFDYCTNTVSCHMQSYGKMSLKPRGFSSTTKSKACHLRLPTSTKYNPFDLKNTGDLTPALQPSIPDPDCPSKPLVRCISNKFPALGDSLEMAVLKKSHEKTAGHMNGLACGYQEVIIQHWNWRFCQALMSTEQMILLWTTLQTRCKVNRAKNNVKYIQCMENHGIRSGASLPHPHSQILALPFVPPDQMARLEIAAKYYSNNNEQNIFDAVIDGARKDGRIVYETENAISIIPYAVNRSYETWIISKTSGCIDTETHMNEMADVIRRSLLMLYNSIDDPDYNSIVRNAIDIKEMHNVDVNKWYKWHVVVTPHGKTSTWGGIKGYGDFVPITGTPEEHAENLRMCIDMPSPLQSILLNEKIKVSATTQSPSAVAFGRKIIGVVMLINFVGMYI